MKDCCAIRTTYLTAWHGLVDRGQIREGEWVLINAAAGGVGSAAVQIAKYFNCVVVATCGSAEKAKVCKDLGADYVVDYNADPNWGTTIKEITIKAGKKWAGVDVFCGFFRRVLCLIC
jgi:NADPH2:quinone reductase